MRRFNLNANQIHAMARANMKGAANDIAARFNLANELKAVGMSKDNEFVFNTEIIATTLEAFIYGNCYMTFDVEFKRELAKLDLFIVFGDEGCGYITNDEESLVVYFG